MESFISIFCIGRGIWFPRYTSVNSIERMAQVRSDAAVQWMLFLQCMSSVRVVSSSVRELQQLMGEVERIVEMLEALDRIASSKATEKTATFVCGEGLPRSISSATMCSLISSFDLLVRFSL